MIGNVFCHVLKIIRFVFLTFVDNLLAFSQVEKLWSWSLRWEVSTSRSLCSKNIINIFGNIVPKVIKDTKELTPDEIGVTNGRICNKE